MGEIVGVRVWRCSTCSSQLSEKQVFGSHGTCPYCGAYSGSALYTHATRESELIETKAGPWARLRRYFTY